ncbi:MAG: T9SS C-terminal target domain-containing protein [Ignavibacteriae bacterium]|nr:MAG: T9SS C-terminal target domain-containing protein [Ignavibacteriota bacterium]
MKKTFLLFNFSLFLFYVLQVNNCKCQWVQKPDGMGTTQYGSSFAISGAYLFSGNWKGGGIFLTTNNGESWTSANNGITFPYISSIAVKETYVFAGTNGEGVFRSTNMGSSWTQFNTGLTNPAVWSLTLSGLNLFAGTHNGGVFLTTNNGQYWTAVNNGLTNFNVLSMASVGTNIFAGTENGLFRSTNNGVSWDSVHNGLSNKYIVCFTVSGTNIFAGTVNGVFLSTNYGANWTAVNNGLTSMTVLSIASHGTNLFAGTLNGVFCSVNNGETWTIKNEGFTIIPEVRCLIVANNYVFSGTNYQSVWRRSYPEIIGIKKISTEIPSSFFLSQNYPNPFNPKTIINFQLPMSNAVKLIIYDVMGREAATLVNEKLNPGTYEVEWNASNYPSGVYFYRLVSGNFADTKKLILVK